MGCPTFSYSPELICVQNLWLFLYTHRWTTSQSLASMLAQIISLSHLDNFRGLLLASLILPLPFPTYHGTLFNQSSSQVKGSKSTSHSLAQSPPILPVACGIKPATAAPTCSTLPPSLCSNSLNSQSFVKCHFLSVALPDPPLQQFLSPVLIYFTLPGLPIYLFIVCSSLTMMQAP